MRYQLIREKLLLDHRDCSSELGRPAALGLWLGCQVTDTVGTRESKLFFSLSEKNKFPESLARVHPTDSRPPTKLHLLMEVPQFPKRATLGANLQ